MPENYITVPGEQGNISVSEEVIAVIVGTAIRETEGVASLTSIIAPGITERLGFKSPNRDVSVWMEDGRVRVEAAIYVVYGESIAAIGERAQKSAAAAVETMTGLDSVVNIHVAGVTFDK